MDEGWRFYRGRAEGFTPLPRGKTIDKWSWKTSEKGDDEAEEMAAPGLDISGWEETEPGSDVFEGREGLAWFRAEAWSIAARTDRKASALFSIRGRQRDHLP